MKIVVAPDKFKGSLSAVDAAAAISRGLSKGYLDAEIVEIPIADGGEGTMELISSALDAEAVDVRVTDPLGEPITARYGLAGRRAIIEMSAASGLQLAPAERRDPWLAETFGTGLMIEDALGRGAEEIIVGIGGSATNDGGTGMARALGFEFHLDGKGRLAEIEAPPELPGDLARFVAACDVANPLLGPDGCTRVYGSQKGIVPEDFTRHEERLARLAEVVRQDVAAEISPDTPGAGAAGGLGFGLMAFCGAKLRSGFDLVAEVTGLEQEIATADLVVTGEGSMDAQTLMGKGPMGVADLARGAGKQVVAVCGIVRDEAALLERFDEVISLESLAAGAEDSMARAAELLESAAGRIR